MVARESTQWAGLRLIEPVAEGNKNVVWRGDLAGTSVAVRRSGRSSPSLAWELDLIGFLNRRGFIVPTVYASTDGRRSVDGVVVQSWLDGHAPTSEQDWHQVGAELKRLHSETASYRQRPGCCIVTQLKTARRSVDANLDAMPDDAVRDVLRVFGSHLQTPTAVIHGDVDASNIRISTAGVGFLDWDESRVDLTWHDLSVLPTGHLLPDERARAEKLSHAWEAANGWTVEPDYARGRLERLRELLP